MYTFSAREVASARKDDRGRSALSERRRRSGLLWPGGKSLPDTMEIFQRIAIGGRGGGGGGRKKIPFSRRSTSKVRRGHRGRKKNVK